MGSTHGQQRVLTPDRRLLVEEEVRKEAERWEREHKKGAVKKAENVVKK